ncbi:MAG TPA: peptide-N4-asparagine amidase, partial [Candidatus Eremiobacteraceae bacterium]|nr:peptide-N4-asparagine amidase [Candidatus Eremiobacteraceae bacterium]
MSARHLVAVFVCSAAVFVACASAASAAAHPTSGSMLVGLRGVAPDLGPPAANPILPQPPVSRPATAHCKVTLLANYAFDNYSEEIAPYSPPAGCPGRWSKVILDVDTHVAGVQYDRLFGIWIGGTEIYRGTTVEPSEAGIEYHAEKDVTNYSSQLSSPATMTAMLGNIVNPSLT